MKKSPVAACEMLTGDTYCWKHDGIWVFVTSGDGHQGLYAGQRRKRKCV